MLFCRIDLYLQVNYLLKKSTHVAKKLANGILFTYLQQFVLLSDFFQAIK